MEQGKAHDHRLETRAGTADTGSGHLGGILGSFRWWQQSPSTRLTRDARDRVVSFHYGKTELCRAFSVEAHGKGRVTAFCTVKSLCRAPS
jgi:hypothetical protein